MPEKGDVAPDFEGIDQNENIVRLRDFRGQKVALYFYPKDDTPGCTKQACNLRDHTGALESAGIKVIGVSPDDVRSHVKFAEKYHLPFPLIADPDHTILLKYETWGEKNMYGRKRMGVKRTTFLINPDGTIQHIFKRPKVSEHTEEILAKFSG